MVLTIGIDFDNTLANYSGVFYQVALNLEWIPDSIGQSKSAVKQYFFQKNQHEKWTELQGIVYGSEIHLAQLYQGAKNVITSLLAQGHKVYIISHKTQYPVIGEKTSLHHAATQWLYAQNILGTAHDQLSEAQVYFNQTQAEKIAKISALACDYFIDDLPAIFQHSDFPDQVKKIFFDPDQRYAKVDFANVHLQSWQQMAEILHA